MADRLATLIPSDVIIPCRIRTFSFQAERAMLAAGNKPPTTTPEENYNVSHSCRPAFRIRQHLCYNPRKHGVRRNAGDCPAGICNGSLSLRENRRCQRLLSRSRTGRRPGRRPASRLPHIVAHVPQPAGQLTREIGGEDEVRNPTNLQENEIPDVAAHNLSHDYGGAEDEDEDRR